MNRKEGLQFVLSVLSLFFLLIIAGASPAEAAKGILKVFLVVLAVVMVPFLLMALGYWLGLSPPGPRKDAEDDLDEWGHDRYYGPGYSHFSENIYHSD